MRPLKKGDVVCLSRPKELSPEDIQFAAGERPTDLDYGEYALLGDLPDEQARAPIRRFIRERHGTRYRLRWTGDLIRGVSLGFVSKYGFTHSSDDEINPDDVEPEDAP